MVLLHLHAVVRRGGKGEGESRGQALAARQGPQAWFLRDSCVDHLRTSIPPQPPTLKRAP